MEPIEEATAETASGRQGSRIKLTAVHVKTLRADTAREIEYSDALTPGLRLNVTPNGARVWVLA